jgi:Tfp pilus assembly protein PilF
VLESATKSDPAAGDLRLALAGLYAKEKRTPDAIRTVKEVIAKDPKSERAHYTLAIIYDQAKMQDQAVEQMRQVSALNPKNAAALNYVGYTWAERGVRLEEAEGLIRQAVALKPQDGFIRDSLGWVLYQKGDYPGAVRELEAAARMSDNDPVVLEHLGDAYLKANHRGKALRTWESALRKDPKADNAAKLREKIDQLKRQQNTRNP